MQSEQYAIYLRKSREDRELEKIGEGETLARHEKTLVDFAKNKGFIIGEIYREVVSGETIEERAEMKRLLKDVESRKWAGILVMEVERLARGDTKDQGIVETAFKYSNTKIITPMKIYNPNNEYDEEYFEFGLFMSRREYKTINRRLQRGRMTSIAEGKYVGSIPPFGYQRKKLENAKGYTLVPNPEEAEIVKKIFILYSYEGVSINSVTKEINKLGLKPRKAKSWSNSSIKDILNNPVYIGKIRWNSRKQVIRSENGNRLISRPRNSDITIIDGIHKPIIDMEVWNIVHNKRSLNTPPVPHNNIVQNPLLGLVFCEKCGKPMQRRPYNLKQKEATLICTNPNCNNISSKLNIVEGKIIESLKIWLKDYNVDYSKLKRKKQIVSVLKAEDILKQLKDKLICENEKLNKVYELFEEGTYNKQEFTKRSTFIKNNIKEIEKEIQQIDKVKNTQEEAEQNIDKIIPKIKNVIDIYSKLETSEQKNKLLKGIIEKVTYLKTEKAIKKESNPCNFEIHIYPKIPRFKQQQNEKNRKFLE